MKIYLAGSTKEIDRANGIAEDLAREGHEVLHAWTRLPQDGTAPEEELIWQTCLKQIRQADCVVAVTPATDKARLNGGVFEVGYAVGRGIPVIVYDFRNLQSGTWKYAPGVIYVDNWTTLVGRLSF